MYLFIDFIHALLCLQTHKRNQSDHAEHNYIHVANLTDRMCATYTFVTLNRCSATVNAVRVKRGYGWMDGRTDGQTDVRTDGSPDACSDGYPDGCPDGREGKTWI